MGIAYPEVFARLWEPFHPDDVRVRSHDKMNRLDDVPGPEDWDVKFEPFGESTSATRTAWRSAR